MEHRLKSSPAKQSESVGSCKKNGGGAVFSAARARLAKSNEAAKDQRILYLFLSLYTIMVKRKDERNSNGLCGNGRLGALFSVCFQQPLDI